MFRLSSLIVLILFFFLEGCSFDPSGIGRQDNNNSNTNNTNLNINGNVNDNTNSNNTNNNTNDSCGDGIVETGEECDGEDLNGRTCESLGYSGSGLACDLDCSFDVSACDAPVTCGNGEIDQSEECDTDNLGGATCASLGYHGTGLFCDGSCRLDTSVCEANGRCGDDVLDSEYEECDGSDLGGENCASQGVGAGDVVCSSDCRLDLSGCYFPEVCDDFEDNDEDGMVDCNDDECDDDPWCTNNISTEFGSADERVVIGTLEEVTGSAAPVTSFSVSYWVKFNGYQPNWATPLGMCSNDDWKDGFGFYHSSEDRIRFWINDYYETGVYTSVSIPNDVWHHVVGTYDASQTTENIKIYLNGDLAGSGDSQASVTLSNQSISIGALYSDDMVGFVDEVAFWPVALSPQNVAAIFNGGSHFNLMYDKGTYNQSSNLTAYYRMGDQDSHPVITDHASNHDGVVTFGDGNVFVNDVP